MIKKLINKSSTYPVIFFTLFFIISFCYFFWPGDYVVFFQEQERLFVFLREFLEEYFTRPGGVLELAGDFTSAFFVSTFAGALIISATLTMTGLLFYKINRQLSVNQLFSLVLTVIPCSLLFLMQTHYYHQIDYNFGFILMMLYLMFAILVHQKKYGTFIIIAIFPFVYYLIGGYIWYFLALYILFYTLFSKGRVRYIYPLSGLIVGVISIVVFQKLLFHETLKNLVLNPLPLIKDPGHKIFFYLLTGYFVIHPLLIKIAASYKSKKRYSKSFSLAAVIILFSLTGYLVYKLYNPQTRLVFQLEKHVFEQKWNKAIELHESTPSKNLIGQYFYNIALAESGQLCDRLFFGGQEFGPNALILPWDQSHLNRGAYFYYSLGLSNEAYRWAYESMVVYGYRPQNITILAKTSLINGNYRMTGKYINILKHSLNYRNIALDLEKLVNDPHKVRSHTELGNKVKLLPGEDFFIQINEPQKNIEFIQNSNPNRRAFEYEMAWYLLTKNTEGVINNLYLMKDLGYTKIPKHIEEAVLVYYNTTGKLPELNGSTISPETLERFQQYISDFSTYKHNPKILESNLRKKFSNTFWFYFHFI